MIIADIELKALGGAKWECVWNGKTNFSSLFDYTSIINSLSDAIKVLDIKLLELNFPVPINNLE